VNILIVDDDRGTLNALKAGLISLGYQVLAATDGPEALRIIESSAGGDEPVNLVVTDLKMQGMNGLELIRFARQVILGLPAILMTGYGDNHIRKEVKEIDDCEYIDKPFSPESLQKIIEETIAGHCPN
jgi:CheY-like chemotaxis protein